MSDVACAHSLPHISHDWSHALCHALRAVTQRANGVVTLECALPLTVVDTTICTDCNTGCSLSCILNRKAVCIFCEGRATLGLGVGVSHNSILT